jgi:hypothetical protein
MEKLGSEFPADEYTGMHEMFIRHVPRNMGDIKPEQVLISAGKYLDILVQTFHDNLHLRFDGKRLVFYNHEDDVGWSGSPGTPDFLGGIIGQYRALNKPYADSILRKQDMESRMDSIFGPKL